MKVEKNVSIGRFSWLNNKIYQQDKGGVIHNLFLPESVEELKNIVIRLFKTNSSVLVFGHTSNSYFLPSFQAEEVVCTRLLSHYEVLDDRIVCQPGAHIKKIARELTGLGVKGYSGLVDLPGTVAAAVVGNAGCYGCETKDILASIDLLLPDGSVITLQNEDLRFARRSSILKRKELEGVILTVTLRKEYGIKDLLVEHASQCQADRKKTQPSAANNLGSCFMSGSKTLGLRIMERVVYNLGKLFGLDEHERLAFFLRLYGNSDLIPYLYDINRFMWIDNNSHEAFKKYVSFYQKIHKNASLEIQVYR